MITVVVNILFDEAPVDDRKFQGDTIQTLSVNNILEIPFAIWFGWKQGRLFDFRHLHQTSLQTSGMKSEATSRRAEAVSKGGRWNKSSITPVYSLHLLFNGFCPHFLLFSVAFPPINVTTNFFVFL
jgi:hypothetical protein